MPEGSSWSASSKLTPFDPVSCAATSLHSAGEEAVSDVREFVSKRIGPSTLPPTIDLTNMTPRTRPLRATERLNHASGSFSQARNLSGGQRGVKEQVQTMKPPFYLPVGYESSPGQTIVRTILGIAAGADGFGTVTLRTSFLPRDGISHRPKFKFDQTPTISPSD